MNFLPCLFEVFHFGETIFPEQNKEIVELLTNFQDNPGVQKMIIYIDQKVDEEELIFLN